jgi:hypothetical protein
MLTIMVRGGPSVAAVQFIGFRHQHSCQFARASASHQHELRRLRKPKHDSVREDANVGRNFSRLILGPQFIKSLARVVETSFCQA